MAGILDFLNNQGPEQSRSLLAAAAQILQQSGPSRTPQGLGQILGSGVSAYYDSQDQQRARGQQEQLRGLQIKGAESDLAQQQRALEKQARIDDVFRNSYQSAGAQAASLPGGPTVENAARIGEFEDGFNSAGAIEKLWSIDPEYALKLQQSMKKVGPKYDSGITFVNGPDGKPVAVRTADDGSVKQVEGYTPREKREFENLGGRSVAFNPYDLQDGQSFQRTATPGDLLSAATQRRGQDITARGQIMSDARQREEFALKQQIGKAPTEFQGKSGQFALRMGDSDQTIRELDGKYNPAAINAKANVEDWPLIGGALGALTNKFALSESDQKAEQAQRDWVNANLRQESGAAIGKDEFGNARIQYFPQPGDGPQVIAQKARNRQLAEQGMRANAGRAAMTAPPRPVTNDGWSIRKVQ